MPIWQLSRTLLVLLPAVLMYLSTLGIINELLYLKHERISQVYCFAQTDLFQEMDDKIQQLSQLTSFSG